MELVVQQSRRLLQPNSRRDVNFYKRLFGKDLEVPDYTFKNDPPSEISYKKISARGDARLSNAVAGFFTTPEFFNRYYNSGTNENRKRAAAMYRLVLCDEMKPVILSDEHLERELLMATINDLTAEGRAQKPVPSPSADQHASNPECQLCHRKLEPAGKLFSASAKSPTPSSLASQFVFDQQSVNVIGLGQWVDAALATEASKSCQIRFFWNLAIGKNVPLSEKQMADLRNSFAASGESVPQLLAKLVTLPEFSESAQDLEARPVTIRDVKPLLRRCDSCHSGKEAIPEFAYLPYASDPASHARWLKKIAKETDIHNLGAKSVMPPAKAGWKPTTMEYRLLAKWLADGARDENGKPTTDEQIVVNKPKLGLSEATFLPTFRRYLRQRELERITTANYTTTLPSVCFFPNIYSSNNEPTLIGTDLGGFSFTKLGPLIEVPGPNYFTFIGRCVAPAIAQNFMQANRAQFASSIKMGNNDTGIASAMFNHFFGEHRIVGAAREAMINRALNSVRAKRSTQAEVSVDDLALDFAIAFSSTPEFLVY